MKLIIRHLLVTISLFCFLSIALIIFRQTLSSGITQNRPSPFAIRVYTGQAGEHSTCGKVRQRLYRENLAPSGIVYQVHSR